LIEFRDVTKTYNSSKTPALQNVSFQIERGEFVFLVGPSGAGKSTMLRLLFREYVPTSGQVGFLGRDTAKFTQRELLRYRRRIGMVFQDFRLLKQKTVFENVAFAMEVVGRPQQEIRLAVPSALDEVGLADKGRKFPGELSGGEQQRVGIARAIVRKPMLIIADEPTGNVDPENAWQLMELFSQISRTGTTVLIATHASEIVDRMRQRVIALEKGCLVRDAKRGAYNYES